MRIEQNLRHTTGGLSPRLRNRDRILISNYQQQSCERRYGNNRLQPAQPSAARRSKLFRELVRALLPQDFARSVRKCRECLDVDRAFRAIEIMLLVLVPLDLGEFAEHILYCRLQL